MPRKCIICKSISSPFEKRSFHTFPKDELIRNKWIESLNLTNKKINFKTANICSNHFDEKSFYEQGELHTKKRLLLDAVPQLINTVKASTSIVKEDNYEECNTLQDINVDKKINIQQNEITSINSSDVKDSDNIIMDLSKKREKPPDVKLKTKVRFMTGFQTEHMCREDFVSEEAWNKFLRYRSYCRSIATAAYSRNQRKETKINSLKEIIDVLQQEDDLDAAEYLHFDRISQKEDLKLMNDIQWLF